MFGVHNAAENPSVGTKATRTAPVDSFVVDRDVSFSPKVRLRPSELEFVCVCR